MNTLLKASPVATGCAALLVILAAQSPAQVPAEAGPDASLGGYGTVLRPEDVPLARELHAAALESPTPGTRGAEPWIVPITVHVVRQSDGTGGLPAADLAACLADANDLYAELGIQFVQPRPTRFIDNDDVHYNIGSQEQLDALRSTDVVCGTINVYFTPALNVGDVDDCGFSSFTFDPVQGIVIGNNCTGTGDNSNSEFQHQLGHYFNLYDTHETRFGFECVDGSNCLVAGDLICDTPADPNLTHLSLNEFCQYNGPRTDSCNGDSYSPQEWNMMSHANPRSCRWSFWGTQYDVLVNNLVNLRLDDWSPDTCSCGMLVWVDQATLPPFFGTQPRPYYELTDGLEEVCSGGTIYLRPGAYTEAPLTINQPVTLRAIGGSVRIIQ